MKNVGIYYICTHNDRCTCMYRDKVYTNDHIGTCMYMHIFIPSVGILHMCMYLYLYRLHDLVQILLVCNLARIYFGNMPGKDIFYWKVEREWKLRDCFSNFPFPNCNSETSEDFDAVENLCV